MNVSVLDELDELEAVSPPPRLCLCGCGKPVAARSGPGRPAVYATPECRRQADNQRDRDRREAERSTFDGFLSRASRNGRLEHKQLPTTGLPDDYWTGLALAAEVVTFHGPAVDSADDPRLAAFTEGVCRIIAEGTEPPEVKVLDVIPDEHMTVVLVSEPQDGRESAADRLARLYELRDPGRQPGMDIARYAWGDDGSTELTEDVLYSPLGRHPRTSQAIPAGPTPQASAEFYDRDPRRPYQQPYFGLAWNHGPEAIADHIAPALAAYAEDAT